MGKLITFFRRAWVEMKIEQLRKQLQEEYDVDKVIELAQLEEELREYQEGYL